jgi:hypothetical protein
MVNDQTRAHGLAALAGAAAARHDGHAQITANVHGHAHIGRITRQKGIIHLVQALKHLDPGFQVVLCAGAPDTPEIAAEM